MKKLLPIGKQDFQKLIQGDYLYVDKTRYLLDLIKQGEVFFLSRPRRFGKSLTLSTFKAIFEGKKELFNGTWIYDNYDFKPYPVIHISMSEMLSLNENALINAIDDRIRRLAENFGVNIISKTFSNAFSELVERISKNGRVVLLIDEYDKPILDSLADIEKAAKMREILRSFYVTIKDLDPYLRFVFMTGISKFTKVGVFSALNNLRDISMNSSFAPMLGYTQNELEYYFADYIEETADVMHLTKEDLLAQIKEYYNGFSFDGRHFVYNPFSILNFFADKEFRNYWFESATPSFIADYAKHRHLKMNDYRRIEVSTDFASMAEIERTRPESFLYQAGYLSIAERTEDTFFLDYPNKEVLSSMSKLFMDMVYETGNEWVPYRRKLSEALESGDVESLMAAFDRVLAAIPYNLFEKTEKYYHSVFLVLLWASGAGARGEDPSRLGRADIVIEWNDRVYILELKLAEDAEDENSRSIAAAEKALKQIEERDYHGQYMDGRNITLIGIGIDAGKRKIGGYVAK